MLILHDCFGSLRIGFGNRFGAQSNSAPITFLGGKNAMIFFFFVEKEEN